MDTKTIKNFLNNNALIIIFILCFILFLCTGFYITYFNKSVIHTRFDLIYSYDSGKYFGQYYVNHFLQNAKSHTHPLFKIYMNPIICLFECFTATKLFNAIVFPSLIQAFTTCLLYLTMIKAQVKQNFALIFTAIFACSLTVLLSAAIPETYIFSSFAQMLLLYFTISYTNQNPEYLSFKNILVISFLIVFCFGINFIGVLLSLPAVIYIIYKTKSDKIKNFCKIFVLSLILIFSLNAIQMTAYNQKSFISSMLNKKTNAQQTKTTSRPEQNLKQTKTKSPLKEYVTIRHPEQFLIKGTLIEPFYALQSSVQPHWRLNQKMWFFNDRQTNKFLYLPIIILLLTPFIKNRKKENNKKYNNFIVPLCAILLLQTICNLFFCTRECFLFAPNFFAAFIILLGLLYNKTNTKISYIVLFAFLAIQIFINFTTINKIVHFISNNNIPNILLCFAYALIIASAFVLLYMIFKPIIKDNLATDKKYHILAGSYFVYMIIFALFLIITKGYTL